MFKLGNWNLSIKLSSTEWMVMSGDITKGVEASLSAKLCFSRGEGRRDDPGNKEL